MQINDLVRVRTETATPCGRLFLPGMTLRVSSVWRPDGRTPAVVRVRSAGGLEGYVRAEQVEPITAQQGEHFHAT